MLDEGSSSGEEAQVNSAPRRSAIREPATATAYPPEPPVESVIINPFEAMSGDRGWDAPPVGALRPRDEFRRSAIREPGSEPVGRPKWSDQDFREKYPHMPSEHEMSTCRIPSTEQVREMLQLAEGGQPARSSGDISGLKPPAVPKKKNASCASLASVSTRAPSSQASSRMVIAAGSAADALVTEALNLLGTGPKRARSPGSGSDDSMETRNHALTEGSSSTKSVRRVSQSAKTRSATRARKHRERLGGQWDEALTPYGNEVCSAARGEAAAMEATGLPAAAAKNLRRLQMAKIVEETPEEDEDTKHQRFLASFVRDPSKKVLQPGEAFDSNGVPLPDALRERMIRPEWMAADGCYRYMCNICNKEATAGHLTSKAHLDNEREFVITTRFFGLTTCTGRGIRRQGRKGGVGGFSGPLRKDALLGFWGAQMPDLPDLVKEKFAQQGTITVVRRKGKRDVLHASKVTGVHLAMVSYSGTGKYKEGQALRFWVDIPDDESVYRSWKDDWDSRVASGQVGRDDRLVVPKEDYEGWSSIDDPLQPDQSWWPVVCLRFDDESMVDVRSRIATSGKTLVLVICFYQFLEDELTGWWMEVIQYWAAANRWGLPSRL